MSAGVEEFLRAIWGSGPHALCWKAPGGFPFVHCDTPEEAVKQAEALGVRDIWVSAHPLTKVPERGRGVGDDVAEVVVLHADIDWADPAHDDKTLPTEEEVRAALDRLPPDLRPSAVVNTGHGLHCWWFLAEPVPPKEGADLLGRLTATLEGLGLENGRPDLASVLRLPGTMNCKTDPPVPVSFEVCDPSRRFDASHLSEQLAEPTSSTRIGSSRPGGGPVTEDQRKLAEHLIADYRAELVRVSGGVIFLRYPGASFEHSATVWEGDRGDAVATIWSDNWVKEFPDGGRRSKHFVLGWGDRLHLADDPEAFVRFTAEVPTAGEQEDDEDEDDGFDRVPLRPYLNGKVIKVVPDLSTMTDGRSLLHRGRLNGVHGDSGSGKSWFVEFGIKEIIESGQAVMVIDLEDTPDPLIERLRQIGVADRLIDELVVFVRPDEAFSVAKVRKLIKLIEDHRVVHVFLETLGEAFSLEGINEDRDAEVTPWISRVCRRITEETGAGVTLIDHGTKSAEKPLDPSGTKRKRAAITGTSWLMKAQTPFDRACGGVSVLVCAKDRHGWFKQGESVARLLMGPVDPTGHSTLRLEPTPAILPGSTGGPGPEVLAVKDALRDALPNRLSQAQVVASVRNAGHRYGDHAIRRAVDQAVLLGLAKETSGPRNSRMFEAL